MESAPLPGHPVTGPPGCPDCVSFKDSGTGSARRDVRRMAGAHGEPPWLSEDEIEDLSYKERLDRAAACLRTAQTPLCQSGASRFERTSSS